jgi:hypothetical protein
MSSTLRNGHLILPPVLTGGQKLPGKIMGFSPLWMWLKPQKAGGRFCLLAEANGNKTSTLFFKLMTFGNAFSHPCSNLRKSIKPALSACFRDASAPQRRISPK